MDIRDIYTFENKIDSFGQYRTPKQYQNVNNHLIKSPKRSLKKATYINEIEKLSRASPGVGKYIINPQKTQSPKRHRKIDFTQLQKNGTHTYVDDVIKKKKKIPLVGKYDLVKDQSEQIRKKYKAKGDAMRKKAPLFRPTALDDTNVDTAKISPGQYEVLKPLGYKSQRGSISPEPKKSESLPKLPSAFDYKPIPVSYETFSRKASVSSLSGGLKTSTFGHKQKAMINDKSPGPKYNLISNWIVQQDKSGRKKGKNLFKSTSNLKTQSIYH